MQHLTIKKITMICSAILFAGCSSPGVLTIRQINDETPKTTTVPEDGNYAIFIAGESQSLYEFPLKKGQQIGFEHSQDGIVTWMLAIAGNNRFRLDVTKTYEWRRLEAATD